MLTIPLKHRGLRDKEASGWSLRPEDNLRQQETTWLGEDALEEYRLEKRKRDLSKHWSILLQDLVHGYIQNIKKSF